VKKFKDWLNEGLDTWLNLGLKEDAPAEAKKAFKIYKKKIEDAGEKSYDL
jgi:hypothetical protein